MVKGFRRTRLLLTAVVAMAVMLSSLVASALPGDSQSDTLTGREKAVVGMAVDVLKLTGHSGTLPAKLGGADGPKGLRTSLAGALGELHKDDEGNPIPGSPVLAGTGETDGGRIVFSKHMFEPPKKYPDPAVDITSTAGLIALPKDELTGLIKLAELTLHEFTHTQQTAGQDVGSDVEFEPCGPQTAEAEAYALELEFKLELRELIVAEPSGENRGRALAVVDKAVEDLREEARARTDPKPSDGTPKSIWGVEEKRFGTMDDIYEKDPVTGKPHPNREARLDEVKKWREGITGHRETLRPPPPKKSSAKGMVPASGGVCALPDGQATVEIPPGSLMQETVIEVHEHDLDDLAHLWGLVSPIYSFEPHGTHFSSGTPARLTFAVPPGVQIETVGVMRLRTGCTQGLEAYWLPVTSGKTVDHEARTITVAVDRFSFYGLSGSEEPREPYPVPAQSWWGLTLLALAGLALVARGAVRRGREAA